MKTLPNLLTIAWALAVLAGFSLGLAASPGGGASARATARIAIFGFCEGAALLVALVAAGLSLRRADPLGSKLWWLGWAPLLGMVVIVGFVGLAVLLFRTL